MLANAIVAGFARRPEAIAANADLLARAAELDPRFDAILEMFESGEALDSQGVATTLSKIGREVPVPSEFVGVRSDFLMESAPPAEARAALRELLSLLVERPALEAALAAATARHEQAFSDETFAEQQRLRKRLLEFDEGLRQMAGARAAGEGTAHPEKMAG